MGLSTSEGGVSAEIDVAKNVASKTEPDLNILLTQASPLRWPFVNVENGALERFRIYCGEGVVGHLGWGRVIAHRDLSGNLLLACELYCYRLLPVASTTLLVHLTTIAPPCSSFLGRPIFTVRSRTNPKIL